jgi:hypothetical protein
MYPFDVIRTKMQTSGMMTSTTAATVHRSPMQVVQHTIGHGGIRALYTGMAPVLAAQGVYKATVFAVNNVTQTMLLEYGQRIKEPGQSHQSLTSMDRFWCGAMGGAVNAFLFVTPVEFVRNQLIAQHSREAAAAKSVLAKSETAVAASVKQLIRQTVAKHGWTSLWRGATWSVARDGWGCGWFFVTMAGTQQLLTEPGEQPTFPVTVVAGGMAGLAFWLTSLPLDTVKTWIQSAEVGTTVTATESVSNILRQQGVRGVFQQLFRGWQVAYGRGFPSAAITISVYSSVYTYLDPMRHLLGPNE